MNFFEHQDRAHRHTKVLVFYLLLALIIIVSAVYFLAMAFFMYYVKNAQGWYNLHLLLWVSGIVLGIVLLGTLGKIICLRAGGRGIVRLLGGDPVDPGSQDLAERRLLNVVEEMAIASGTAVPAVFLLRRERGINAFAAGFTPSDAVIGVTPGCLSILTRDELQGVIAHEFSHILNGDMHLNLRLIGIVHGIMIIGILGRALMQPFRIRAASSTAPSSGTLLCQGASGEDPILLDPTPGIGHRNPDLSPSSYGPCQGRPGESRLCPGSGTSGLRDSFACARGNPSQKNRSRLGQLGSDEPGNQETGTGNLCSLHRSRWCCQPQRG